jgi:hypothetical protein
MRHLKRFNEDLDDGGLKDFCETYLAYLMDEGFILHWTRIYGDDPKSGKETWLMSLRMPAGNMKHDTFKWSDIKDQIIRFAYLINKEYEVPPFAERTMAQRYQNGNGDQKKFRVLLPQETRMSITGFAKTTPTKDLTLEELEDLEDDFLLTSFSLKVVDKL